MFRNVDFTAGGGGVRPSQSAGHESLSEQLQTMPAGPELAALVFGTDPALLDPDSQVSYVQACQRLINTITAVQDAGIVAFVGNNPRDTVFFVDGTQHTLTDARALELQLALAWSEGFTRTRMATARALTTRLPNCSSAVAAGVVQPVVARALAEGALSLTASIDEAISDAIRTKALRSDIDALRQMRAALLATFDTTLAAYAPERSLKQVGRKVRDLIARLDPAGVLARRARAIRTQSDVRVTNLADGMACLTAIMPTERAHACLKVIDCHARDTNAYDATDPIGLRRTRVLFDLVTRNRQVGVGLPVHLDVVMNLGTFLGLTDDTCAMPTAGALPAHAARELLGGAAYVKFRRILTDPRTGHALDIGVKRYKLTPAEQQRIGMRDRHCRMIDCDAPAYRCECDHAQPYGDGGPTKTENLGLACKRHHQHKTHAGWTITDSTDDGSCTWTSPLGRQYVHEAEPVMPLGLVLPDEPQTPPTTDPADNPPPF